MPFDPEHLESETSISAGAEAAEPAMESEFSESIERRDEEIGAQAHTIKVGSVG